SGDSDTPPDASTGIRGSRALVEAGRLQKPVAVAGGDLEIEHLAIAKDCQGNFNARFALAPDALEEIGESGDLFAADGKDDVTGLQVGLGGGAIAGKAGDDDVLVDLGGVEAEPRSRRPV